MYDYEINVYDIEGVQFLSRYQHEKKYSENEFIELIGKVISEFADETSIGSSDICMLMYEADRVLVKDYGFVSGHSGVVVSFEDDDIFLYDGNDKDTKKLSETLIRHKKNNAK